MLSQSVRRINACKRFFSTLTGLSTFFSRSTKRSSDFNCFLKCRIPTACETRWNSKACLVGTVQSIFSHLLAFFNDVIDSPQSWDDATVDAAGGYISKMKGAEFMLLLVFQTSLSKHLSSYGMALQYSTNKEI